MYCFSPGTQGLWLLSDDICTPWSLLSRKQLAKRWWRIIRRAFYITPCRAFTRSFIEYPHRTYSTEIIITTTTNSPIRNTPYIYRKQNPIGHGQQESYDRIFKLIFIRRNYVGVQFLLVLSGGQASFHRDNKARNKMRSFSERNPWFWWTLQVLFCTDLKLTRRRSREKAWQVRWWWCGVGKCA